MDARRTPLIQGSEGLRRGSHSEESLQWVPKVQGWRETAESLRQKDRGSLSAAVRRAPEAFVSM